MNSIISVITSLLLLFSVHPLHVSVTEIDLDEKDKALEITMRIFVDDLEQALRKNLHQPELDVLKPAAGVTTDQLAQEYIKGHFKISLDNKPQKINYLGHEVDGEAFIFYVEVSNVKKWKTIDVFNTINMDTFEDQSNLVHVKVKGVIRSLRLTSETISDKLIFENK